jgi:hypothetical protein
VVADGKTIYSEVVKKGKSGHWKANNSLQLTLGNAGGADVRVNDKDLGALGKTGEVVTKTFKTKE